MNSITRMKLPICFLIFLPGIIFAIKKTPIKNQDIAALVIDVQNCFTLVGNGSLPVAGTDDAYISKVSFALKKLKYEGVPLYATQDWHPQGHISFSSSHGKEPFTLIKLTINGKDIDQMLWPDHCEQNTSSAKLLLDEKLFTSVIKKGTDKNFDSYSAFEDDNGKKTGLELILKKAGIKKVLIFGIATDYCVKATALDAKKAGFDVTVVASLSRGVSPATVSRAFKEMREQGIHIIDTINYKKIETNFE